MNKAQLVERMSKLTKEPKTTCKRCIEEFMHIVAGELKKGGDVALTGFGTFTVMKRKARTGVHPLTGEPMQIRAKRVPKFKPGKALKGMVEK